MHAISTFLLLYALDGSAALEQILSVIPIESRENKISHKSSPFPLFLAVYAFAQIFIQNLKQLIQG